MPGYAVNYTSSEATGGNAPANVAYLVNGTTGAVGELSAEVNVQSLSADLSFANSTGSLLNFDIDLEVVINDSSQDIDFRVESNDVANFLHVDAGNNVLGIGAAGTAAQFVTVTQRIATTGSPNALVVTGAAHTTLTALTEAIDVLFDLARTVQWAQGNITTQRAVNFEAPTWATATSSSTFANGVGVNIDSAPNAGTNCVFTALSALRVGSENVTVGATSSGLNYATIRVPAHTATVSGTTQVTASPGIAGLSIAAISVNDASDQSVTIDTAAALYIAAAPAITGGSTVTITTAYQIWCDGTSASRFDGPLYAADGTATAPSITFANDNDTGFYFITNNQWGWTSAGTQRVQLTAGQALLQAGDAATPGISFLAQADTGIFRPASNSVGVSCAGVEVVRWTQATTGGGWQVMDEADSDPGTGNLDSLDSFSVYMKNDKFVIAYNNAGTITYIRISMDGSATTWVHNTTAP